MGWSCVGFGSVLGRFWVSFGSVLGLFRDVFGMVLGCFGEVLGVFQKKKGFFFLMMNPINYLDDPSVVN